MSLPRTNPATVIKYCVETSIFRQVPLGVQIATAIRIGQYLGAGQTTEAKTVGRLAITIVGKLLAHVITSSDRWGITFGYQGKP